MVAKRWLYYAAAATTAIAGILHLIAAPNMFNFNPNGAILFFVGGAAQLFWVVPLIRKWGRPWYAAGIGGTAVLIALFVITRFPDNPITGRGGGVQPNAMVIEAMQVAFIGLAAAILAIESRAKAIKRTETTGF
jgi:hypothetical protein